MWVLLVVIESHEAVSCDEVERFPSKFVQYRRSLPRKATSESFDRHQAGIKTCLEVNGGADRLRNVERLEQGMCKIVRECHDWHAVQQVITVSRNEPTFIGLIRQLRKAGSRWSARVGTVTGKRRTRA